MSNSKSQIKKRVKVGKFKTVFKGLIYEIKQAEAISSDGEKRIFEQAVRPPSVSILALDNKDHLLLLQEYRWKFKRYFWRLPAGRVEGENPKEAAQRELREETGYKASNLKLFHIAEMGQTLDWKIYCYLGKGLIWDPLVHDDDEDIKVVPTPLEKAWEMVLEGKIENELMAYLIMKLYHHKDQYLK